MLAVTGMSMVSPVGLTVQQTCAAIRSGISSFTEIDGIVNRSGDSIFVGQVPSIEDVAACARTKQIAEKTLQDVLFHFPKSELAGRPIVLCLLTKDNARPGNSLEVDKEIPALIKRMGLSSRTTIRSYPHGNAAGIRALADANSTLKADPETIVLLLGVDSLLDIQALAYLEADDRLKGPRQPRGVIPGEAGACIVVESEQRALARRARIYCNVRGIGHSQEKAPVGSDAPCLGDGLTQAIYLALEMARWGKAEVGEVYCDLNGEAYRAHEWMLALCRTLDDPTVTHPADCIGDIGAAFVPFLTGVAAMAFEKGYATSSKAIIFCSSDFGMRGCVCLEPPSGNT